jgi:predicted amidohydrolase
MRFVVACVPAIGVLSDDGSHPLANAARLDAVLGALCARDSRVRVAVLPCGCLSAGRGLAGPAPRGSPAVAALARTAARLNLHVVLADAFDGGPRGCILNPLGEVALEQDPIGAQAGAARIEVLSTPLGEFACLVGEDPLAPEYVRLAVFRGAEYVFNPATGRADHRAAAREFSRGARAWENHLVLASASLAGVAGPAGAAPAAFDGRGNGEIWGCNGELLAQSASSVVTAVVDTDVLRARRAEPWVNFPAQLRSALYGPIYRRAAEGGWPTTPAPAAPTAVPDPAYDVLLMQAHQTFVTDLETRDATIAGNLSRALMMARPFCLRPQTRLAVFPEFFLQGASGERSLEFWEKSCIRVDGPEVATLGQFARECNIYLCGAILEYDPEWPQRFFNTALILSPAGEVILRYRKLQCADLNGLLNITTPGNIYSAYVERYGPEALVPVVDTEIGRLGALVCFDSNWPELWRALRLQGVEVVCNPTSEIHSSRREPWYRAKRAHAAENQLYVASSNCGSEQFHPSAMVTGMNRGHSALIDYDGALVACADGPGVVPLLGRIDLGALRRARADAADDPLTDFRAAAVAEAYLGFPGFPLDCFALQPMQRAAEGPAKVRAQIARLTAAGVLKAAH